MRRARVPIFSYNMNERTFPRFYVAEEYERKRDFTQTPEPEAGAVATFRPHAGRFLHPAA